MAAYYNENDPKTAAWLRELIKAGLIADGEVDTRSIVDVRPDDLRGFVQCHFFAGIGGWSYALRLAGWPDDRECWTGSCPCQPFSSAGTQAGGADARDLWPAWFRLIPKRRPRVIFGEQVEAAIGHGWLDRLCDDLEGEGYAIGPVGVPSAGVGAFDLRQRLWFVADSNGGESGDVGIQRRGRYMQLTTNPPTGNMADGHKPRRGSRRASEAGDGRHAPRVESSGLCHVGDTGHASRQGLSERERDGRIQPGALGAHQGKGAECSGDVSDVAVTDDRRCEVTNLPVRPEGQEQAAAIERGAGFWSAADWIPCADGKWRPVEPGTFPLAHGLPARVGRLRGYGNAINPWVAKEVIAAYREISNKR